jgi:hypothetical protein
VSELAEPLERTFSSGDVCVVTGASYRRVDFWLTSGYIPAALRHPGSGQARQFTFDEVLAIAVMAELVQAGVNPRDVPLAQVMETGTFGNGPVQIRVDIPALRAQIAAALEPDNDERIEST